MSLKISEFECYLPIEPNGPSCIFQVYVPRHPSLLSLCLFQGDFVRQNFSTGEVKLIFGDQVVQEYERAVIFRIGRLLPGGAKGPGLHSLLDFVKLFQRF